MPDITAVEAAWLIFFLIVVLFLQRMENIADALQQCQYFHSQLSSKSDMLAFTLEFWNSSTNCKEFLFFLNTLLEFFSDDTDHARSCVHTVSVFVNVAHSSILFSAGCLTLTLPVHDLVLLMPPDKPACLLYLTARLPDPPSACLEIIRAFISPSCRSWVPLWSLTLVTTWQIWLQC